MTPVICEICEICEICDVCDIIQAKTVISDCICEMCEAVINVYELFCWVSLCLLGRKCALHEPCADPARGRVERCHITYFNLLFLCMWLQVINKVKVTHQGQGHISKSRSNQCQAQIKVIFKKRCSYAGGLHLNKMRSCSKNNFKLDFHYTRNTVPIRHGKTHNKNISLSMTAQDSNKSASDSFDLFT